MFFSVVGLVSGISGNEIRILNGSGQGARVGQAIIEILFYGFGLYAAHRYSQKGLRIVCINSRFLLSHLFEKD